MNRALWGIALSVGLAAGGILGFGMTLPQELHIERYITTPADVAQTRSYMSDLRTWPQWTAWNTELDADIQWTFTGEPHTVGHTMHWEGPIMGVGDITLTSVDADGITYDLTFEGLKPSHARLHHKGDQLIWTDDVPLGYNPLNRIIGRKVEMSVGEDFVKGLINLSRSAEADTVAMLAATTALAEFGGKLKGTLVDSLKSGDAPATVDMCRTMAPALAEQMTTTSGVSLGRASVKLRNPKNAGPDWVQAWLKKQPVKAEGVTGFTRFDSVDGKRYARVVKPLAVDGPCVQCHGAELSDDVSARLAEHYPEDQATGYAVGDLRGAMWAEYAVPEVVPLNQF